MTSDVDGRLAGCVCGILVVGKVVEVDSSVSGLIITNVLATDASVIGYRSEDSNSQRRPPLIVNSCFVDSI